MAAQDVNTSIEAALEAAASEPETETSSETVESTETVAEVTEGKTESRSKSGKGAQDRIQDLLASAKGLESKVEELTGTVGNRDEEIGKLVDLLEMRDNDAKVVAKINELHSSSPEFKDIIETLDKAIRGEEVELPGNESAETAEAGAEDGTDVLAKAQRLVKQAEESLESRLADQEADLLLHKADILTDKYIAELPEEYNEQDIKILKTVLVDHINWDAIEASPDALPEQFAEGFQRALNWYETPKGTKGTAPKGDESATEAPQEVTQEVLDKFADQDWGKLKEVTTPDGTVLEPEVSEEDFTKSLGQMMRNQNELG